MPDLKPEVLLKMHPSKRWAARMNQAWHECRSLSPEKIAKLNAEVYVAPKVVRPEDARFYTDYAPIQEVPDPSKPPIKLPNGKTVQPVRRERKAGVGTIQVWRPGKAPKGALSESYNGEDWYGYAADVPLNADWDACVKAVHALIAKVGE